MEKQYKIYKLINPVNQEIGYIGATTKKLNERLSQHKYNALTKNNKTKICNWFRDVVNNFNVVPEIQLIENCDKNSWQEKEIFWIEKHPNTFNTEKGGRGIILNRSQESVNNSAKSHHISIVQLDKEYNLLKIWNSTVEATKFLNLNSHSAIGNVLKGRSNYCCGFIFLTLKDFESGNFKKIKRKAKTTIIYQYDSKGNFIQAFSSVTEASKNVLSKYSSSIYEAAKKQKVSHGFLWSFIKKNNLYN